MGNANDGPGATFSFSIPVRSEGAKYIDNVGAISDTRGDGYPSHHEASVT